MKLIVNTFGTQVRLKQEVTLESASCTLQQVLEALRKEHGAALSRFLTDSGAPVEGVAILINGRNMLSLDRYGTMIHDGDELTLTVQVAGGSE
ncbi:MAG TPA: MoaD/ThiS family protein [Candidatus Sulfotelmatobacter sp.]|nr:MoaD/ThiS family protein [Candidatus Sulfotelmatobacter sp.]